MLAEMPVDQFVEARECRPRAQAPDDDEIVELNRGPSTRAAACADGHAAPADAQVLDVRDGESFAGGHLADRSTTPSSSGFGTRSDWRSTPSARS